MNSDSTLAFLVAVAVCAIYAGSTYLVIRLYRGGGEQQQKWMRAALGAGFIISSVQAGASNGGYVVALPMVFALVGSSSFVSP